MKHPRLRDDAWEVLRQSPGHKGRAAGLFDSHYGEIRNAIRSTFDDPEEAIVPLDQEVRRGLAQVARRLPYGSPLRFTSQWDVPVELSRAFLVLAARPVRATVGDITDNIALAAWAVQVPPEELYLRWDIRRALRDYWSLNKGRAMVKAIQTTFARAPRSATRVGKDPGPNEPCSCGSGMKYKKCC